MIRAIPSRDCEDCPAPAAPGDHVCQRCRYRRMDEQLEANEERASAKLDGDAPGPSGLMWGDE